ncbi:MAG: hypothetical protein WEC84_02415 [Candidatus Andersenbacteria bacterium]
MSQHQDPDVERPNKEPQRAVEETAKTGKKGFEESPRRQGRGSDSVDRTEQPAQEDLLH